jgi:hypothetical protein
MEFDIGEHLESQFTFHAVSLLHKKFIYLSDCLEEQENLVVKRDYDFKKQQEQHQKEVKKLR